MTWEDWTDNQNTIATSASFRVVAGTSRHAVSDVVHCIRDILSTKTVVAPAFGRMLSELESLLSLCRRVSTIFSIPTLICDYRCSANDVARMRNASREIFI